MEIKMKAYGRNKQHPGNLPDNHPKKGYVNWWEDENSNVKSKKKERQKTKNELLAELEEVKKEKEELKEKLENVYKDFGILTGKDAKKFVKNMLNPKPVSKKEVEKAKKLYEAVKKNIIS
jgi:hypothetical protein